MFSGMHTSQCGNQGTKLQRVHVRLLYVIVQQHTQAFKVLLGGQNSIP